ncbi:DNA-methyltransferase [Desulfovibrio sp.]|uniref:DNA-methyltransferase n=1 Tax=Desulfovibrio sp. TaxID=885 RepID=UPI003D0BC1E5
MQQKILLDRASNLPSEIFFSSRNTTLYHGDAITTMNALPPGVVDLIFADPPYNLSNGGTTCHSGKRVSVNKAMWDTSMGVENDFKFHAEWILACKRLLKPSGSLWISGTYHSIFLCGYALQCQGWHLLNDIIWYKPNASPNLACRMFTASHETLLWTKLKKSHKHYFDYESMKYGDWNNDKLKNPDKQMRSVWSIGSPPKAEKYFGKHPTQKPLALLDRIVIATCPNGGLVLDPFCGSGTTGVAAVQNGRKFIGIDSELSYLEKLSKPRIMAVIE